MDNVDNIIPFPVPARDDLATTLNQVIGEAYRDGVAFADELHALLEKWKFKPSYVAAVVPELMEALLNDDDRPIWEHPRYRPAGIDVDE